MDAFKASRPWITQCTAGQQPDCIPARSWDTGESALLDLDAQGWVRTLPTPQASPTFWSVGTLLFRGFDHYPAGQYVVLYDGEGTIGYGFAAVKDQSASTPGRDVLDVTPHQDGIYLSITATDPNHNGNYLRNIRVIMPGFESNYTTQVFHPTFLSKIGRYKVQRFKDWMDTDGSAQPGDWASRPHLAAARWTAGNGVPVETMIELANRTGSDPWFSMPHRATDDYVTQFATLARAGLNPAQKVYVEYSNEVWNSSFPFSIQASWVEQQGRTMWPGSSDSPFTKRINWFGMRTAQICDRWKSVFGAESSRVVCVMGAFAANSWVGAQALDCPLWTQGAPCTSHGIGALAIAPYFGIMVDDPPSNRANLLSWTNDPDGGLSRLFNEILAGGVLTNGPAGGALQQVYGFMDNNRAVAVARGVSLVAYEGGQSLVDYQNNTALTNLFVSANRDPRMGAVYDRFLAGWRARGGQMFVHFNNTGVYGAYGSFGATEYLDQGSTPKFDALMRFISGNPCWWNGCAGTTSRLYLPSIMRSAAVPP